MSPDNAESVFCSFCGKNHHETAVMIRATTAAVCDECIEGFNTTIFEQLRKRALSHSKAK